MDGSHRHVTTFHERCDRHSRQLVSLLVREQSMVRSSSSSGPATSPDPSNVTRTNGQEGEPIRRPLRPNITAISQPMPLPRVERLPTNPQRPMILCPLWRYVSVMHVLVMPARIDGVFVSLSSYALQLAKLLLLRSVEMSWKICGRTFDQLDAEILLLDGGRLSSSCWYRFPNRTILPKSLPDRKL